MSFSPNRWLYLFIAASILIALPGCGIAPATENPLPTISSLSSNAPGKTLLVMLPGRGDRGEIFLSTGFAEIANRQNVDVLAVDAHLGYYMERSLIPRLHEDVILPARARGYEHIWLLGASMGGFGSLLYIEKYPDQIAGIILLAPYLGSRGLIEEIDEAGGLAVWRGEAEGFEQYEIDIWMWLKEATTSARRTPVVLGFGEADRLAPSLSVLVQALDPSQVYTNDGGHGWDTWVPLMRRIATDLDVVSLD